MDDSVRQTLVELRDEFGLSLLKDPDRLEAHLRDMAPGKNAEIHCLVSAVREGAVADLEAASDAVPLEAVSARLSDRLHQRLGMDQQAARWAVDGLALALGPVRRRPQAQPPRKRRPPRRPLIWRQQTRPPRESVVTSIPSSSRKAPRNPP